MREIRTSGSVGGAAASGHGARYLGTKAETPDTDKRSPTASDRLPYPD
jgi:hypothetical protein